MRFPWQEYWTGLPFPSPRDLPAQGSNPSLPHCRQILYCLSHQGSPTETLQLVINYPLILSYTFTIDVLRGPYNYGKRVWESKRITTRGRVAAGVIEKEHRGASKVLVTFYVLGWVVDTQLLSFTSYTPCLSSFCLTAYKAMANWIQKTELHKCPQSSKLPRCLAKSPETRNNSMFSSLFKLENSERKKKRKQWKRPL